MTQTIRIGTRASRLAMAQTESVLVALRAIAPDIEIEVVPIRTEGDRIQHTIPEGWGKGVFVREIERALLEHRIDLAVHSLKDVPARIPEGLTILATPPRADPRDVLISPGGGSLWSLPVGARIGTSSLRRSAFLRAARPDLEFVAIRGNVDTRLSKLGDRSLGYDALVLAAAGLERLDVHDVPRAYLDPDVLLPAPGQGAIVIEGRSGDHAAQDLVEPIGDPDTAAAVEAERAFLLTLEAGCRLPVAALATVTSREVRLDGAVAAPDGSRIVREQMSGDRQGATELGTKLAHYLLDRGATTLIDTVGRGAGW